jgi:hypothetical protein
MSRDDVIEDLCDNHQGFAERYNFLAWDFAPFVVNHDEPGPFDIDSVMMYGSITGADNVDDCLHVGENECPLLVYQLVNDVPDHNLDPIRFAARTFPSDGDKAFVISWYDLRMYCEWRLDLELGYVSSLFLC